MKKIWIFIFITLTGIHSFGQENGPAAEEGDVTPKRTPVLSEVNDVLVAWEAEDAVSTNFNSQATLDYSASALRTLQLSRYNPLYGGAAFYADYTVYVPQDGTYELWYSGTPAGPEDEISPSYTSPFWLKVDQDDARPVYRENMAVVEQYSPGFYWNTVRDTLTLDKGLHNIRIEVRDKRRMDGKFYFMLDSFFLLKEGLKEVPEELQPAIFPQDLTDRSIDNPFRSISSYENAVKVNPENKTNYIILATTYILMGDYTEALRNLNLARNIDPEDDYVLNLMAKSRIWKGDIQKGLRLYRQLLSRSPEQEAVWAEAGKMAAWTGQYDTSVGFYSDALAFYPESLNLNVNLGLTYLWDSQGDKGQPYLNKAQTLASESPEKVLRLAQIYEVNGYIEKAEEALREGIGFFPDYVELYLSLSDVLSRMGEREKASQVFEDLRTIFESDPILERKIENREIVQGIKQAAINDYRERLAQEPDNLVLREQLVQTLFWNGLKKEAINEYLAILANHAYLAIKEMEENNPELLEVKDELRALETEWDSLVSQADEKAAALRSWNKKLSDYQRQGEKRLAIVAKAQEKGEAAPPLEGADPVEEYRQNQELYEAYLENQLEEAAHIAGLEAQRKQLESQLVTLKEQAAQEWSQFALINQSKGWVWNKEAWLDELQQASRKGELLASYVRARIYQGFEQWSEAEFYLTLPESSQWDPALLYALELQNYHSQEGRPASPVLPAPYDHLEGLSQRASALEASVPLEEGPDLYSFLLGQWTDLDKKAREEQRVLDTLEAELSQIYQEKLNRTFYFLEEKTLLIRLELGNYYTNTEQLAKASRQYEMVLAMDPWNLNSIYRLGVVRQLYGDWHRAMSLYKRVHAVDSSYENTLQFHNLLGSQNPDRLGIQYNSYTDSSNFMSEMNFYYDSAINSVVGYRLDVDHKTSKYYKIFQGSYPLHYSWDRVSLTLPITPLQSAFSFIPRGGVQIYNNRYYDLTESYTQKGDKNLIPEVQFVPGDNWVTNALDYPGFAPFASLKIQYQRDMDLWMEYTLQRQQETLVSYKDNILDHSIALNGAKPFGISYLRAYGMGNYLMNLDKNRSNIKYLLLAEGSYGVHVADNPWTNLNFNANISWEDTQDPEERQYFAPDQVLVTKGGLSYGSWKGLSSGATWGSTGYVNGGLRFEGEDQELSYLLEGQIRIERQKNQGGLFFSLGASQTFAQDPAEQFWSVTLSAGMTAALRDLLSP